PPHPAVRRSALSGRGPAPPGVRAPPPRKGPPMNASSSTNSAGLQFTHPYLAVVLGGGFTGMLAAAALSAYADVIVVERERLPRTPALPTDLPQPRHTHLLTADGARVVEGLLPGTVERWLAEGA